MKLKFTDTEKMILISVGFTMLLLLIRIIYAGELLYIFYPWNILLALIPLYFSRQLRNQKSSNIKAFILIAGWLLFFPNAPYLITDIFHFEERTPVPKWFDLLLVVSAAWNGMVICMVSLRQVEVYFARFLDKRWGGLIVVSFLILCSYGIFLGRYLRYNSWDVFTKPLVIIKSSLHHIWQPLEYHSIWAFTFSFAAFLSLIYFTIKRMQVSE